MGAAIECFAGARAILVPRTRFAPVKTTADLLVLRSDACQITPDWRVELVPARHGQPPVVDLDGKHYKMVDGLEDAFGSTAPSLRACHQLRVRGLVRVPAEAAFRGDVAIENLSATRLDLAARVYENETVGPEAAV
jgi:hypothetical protein